MRLQPWSHSILTLVILMQLSGCDVLLDNAIDCLDSDGPEFSSRNLAMPVLNQVYSDELTARINNEPNDDFFFYEFEIEGALPAGITVRQRSSGDRRLIFEGTAIEQGTFDFTVRVSIDDPSELSGNPFSPTTSGLCFFSRTRDFQLTVVPL